MKYPLLLVMLLFTATSAYSVCNTYPVFGDHCLRQVKVGTEQTIFGIGSHYQLYRNGEPYGSEREGDGDVLIWTVNNPGVYTVRNTYCNIMMSGQFSIASIEASPIACPGGTANLTVNNATNGMTYQLISLSRGPLGTETAVGPTVHFTFVSTTNDTYQVMTGGCLITFPSSLTIGGQSPQPTTATIDVCLPGLRVSNPQGTTFSVYINDVFITSASGSIDVPISVSGSGVYRIDTRTSSNCFFSTILGTLNIDPTPKPIKYNVSLTSGNIYSCVGSTMTKKIGLSDSDVGVNYQLRADESISVQAPKAGTGNAIEWIIDTSQGSQFTVAATRIANGCVEIMNGNVTLQSIDPPEIRTVEVDLCAGKIWVNCPDPNVEYQLYKNGVAEQAPQRQVGYCSTPVQWTGLGSGLYTIKGTNVITTCSSIMANSINVPVNSVPRLFTVSGGGSGCSTGAFNVILSGSDPEVQYTLKDNFNHSLVSKMGKNDTLKWILHNIVATTTYTVEARNTITDCVKAMTASATVVATGPSILPVIPYTCTGPKLTIHCSQTGVAYELYFNGNPVTGTIKNGNGICDSSGMLEWPISTPGIYAVKASRPDGCWAWMANDYTLPANVTPLPFIVDYGSVCSGSTRIIKINNPQPDITYTLYQSPGGMIGSGTGTSASWTVDFPSFPPPQPRNYYVQAQSNYGCLITTNNFQVASYRPTITPSSATYCNSGTLSVNQGIGVTYQWYVNNNPIAGATGASISATQRGTNSYSVKVTANPSTCTSPIATVTVNTTANPSIYTNDATTFCQTGGVYATLRVTVTGSGYGYQWKKDGVAISGATNSTYQATSTGKYTLSLTNACETDAPNFIQVTANAAPATPPIVSQASSCTSNTVTLSSNMSGSAYQWSTGATTSTISVSATGTYTLRVKNSAGCWSPTGSTSVTSVAANNFALTKTGDLCTQGLVTIRVTNVVGTVVSRSWSPISGSGTMITVYDPGTYTCTTTFAGGCQVSRSVFIAQPAGHCQIRLMAADEQDPDQVPAQDFKEEVAVTSFYPNPVDKEINLTTPSEPVARKISLINMQGVEVHTSIMPATATSTRIPLGSLSDGMYLLQIQSPTTVERLKVMVNQKR